MNCVETCVKLESNIFFCQRLWSLKRAQQIVDHIIKLHKEDATPVCYSISREGVKGYYEKGTIHIMRNQSDADKWRTLIHELTHALTGNGERHGMLFIKNLKIVIRMWKTICEEKAA